MLEWWSKKPRTPTWEEYLESGRRLSILGLIVFTILLTLVVIAYHAYPQGEVYRTEPISPNLEFPAYEQMPSPQSNPGWVRFLQNNEVVIPVAIAGWLISFSGLVKRRSKWRNKEQ
jgi:hypothetical protein